MRLAVFFSTVLFALALFNSGMASAEPEQPVTQVAAAGPANAFPGLLGHIEKNMSPLLQPAASYCRRDCDRCRHHCYQRFRVHCHGYECRQHFVLCMRECWNTICRWC